RTGAGRDPGDCPPRHRLPGRDDPRIGRRRRSRRDADVAAGQFAAAVPVAPPEGVSPMRTHGPWTILSSRLVHRDPWVTLTLDDVVRPDGKPGTYTTIAVKPSVSVLA